jgi:pyrroloquinoline-quinone synthase
MLSKERFINELRAELERHVTLDQPIFAELFKAERNWGLLQLMATQGYQLTKNFLTYVEYLFHHCPAGIHKRRLLVNLFEEETGRLSKTANHVELMQRFLRAIGVTDEERDRVEPLPATKELIDYRLELTRDPARFHLGAAAVMIASEGQNLETRAGEARHSILGKVYGLDEAALQFFSVHQKEDVHHVREGIETVADVCTTEEMQQDALAVVRHTCELFAGMYRGIEEEYRARIANGSLQCA